MFDWDFYTDHPITKKILFFDTRCENGSVLFDIDRNLTNQAVL